MAGTASSGSRSNTDDERDPFRLGSEVQSPPVELVAPALRSRVSMNTCHVITGRNGMAN